MSDFLFQWHQMCFVVPIFNPHLRVVGHPFFNPYLKVEEYLSEATIIN